MSRTTKRIAQVVRWIVGLSVVLAAALVVAALATAAARYIFTGHI